MADFGDDLSGLDDLDPTWKEQPGDKRIGLGESLGRRLTTAKGTLFYAPEYGHDVRQYLNAAFPGDVVVTAEVTAEVLEDERVDDVQASVTFTDDGGELCIRLAIESDDLGPFVLTLTVDQLTVDILIQEAA